MWRKGEGRRKKKKIQQRNSTDTILKTSPKKNLNTNKQTNKKQDIEKEPQIAGGSKRTED